jgi:hypothetical protein
VVAGTGLWLPVRVNDIVGEGNYSSEAVFLFSSRVDHGSVGLGAEWWVEIQIPTPKNDKKRGSRIAVSEKW